MCCCKRNIRAKEWIGESPLTCIFPFPREYLANNVSVTVYPVNEPWLFSILWCSGVPSVSSDAPQVLGKMPYPIWLMVNSPPLPVSHLTAQTHRDKVTQQDRRTAEIIDTDKSPEILEGKDSEKYQRSQWQIFQCVVRQQQGPLKESGTNRQGHRSQLLSCCHCRVWFKTESFFGLMVTSSVTP